MREDPYSGLASLMREAGQPKGPVGPVHLRLGTVVSADPLAVDVAGTPQEAARFYISHRLVKEHRELLRLYCTEVSEQFALTAGCPISAHSGSSASASGGTLETPHCVATQAEPVLKRGDEVLLLTEDDQIFFVIDKVVKAG